MKAAAERKAMEEAKAKELAKKRDEAERLKAIEEKKKVQVEKKTLAVASKAKAATEKKSREEKTAADKKKEAAAVAEKESGRKQREAKKSAIAKRSDDAEKAEKIVAQAQKDVKAAKETRLKAAVKVSLPKLSAPTPTPTPTPSVPPIKTAEPTIASTIPKNVQNLVTKNGGDIVKVDAAVKNFVTNSKCSNENFCRDVIAAMGNDKDAAIAIIPDLIGTMPRNERKSNLFAYVNQQL